MNISAIGTYIPQRKLTNFDLEQLVDTSNEWIVKRTGIHSRYVASDSEYASDLAIKAVQNLVENNTSDLNNIDLIITSLLVPDHLTPSVSALVAGHFNMSTAGTFDLHAACSGFVYSLITANAFIASRQANKILLITSETISKVLDYTDRGTCILFGDGAVATLIENGNIATLFASHFGTDGNLADKVYCSLFSSEIQGNALEKERYIVQDGRALYTYVVKNVSIHIMALLAKAQLNISDIDWFIPHSANLRMIDALCERVGFDKSKMLTSVELYGNTSSSSIPLAIWLAHKNDKLKKGDKILLYGFGGGITHAGAIIEW